MSFRTSSAGLIIALIVIVATPRHSLAQFAGEACTVRGGGSGVCRSLTNCPVAQQNLKRGQAPTMCGFDGFTSIVCCPGASSGGAAPVTSRPPRPTRRPPANMIASQSVITNTKSEQKCREYAKAVYVLEKPATLQVDDDFVNRSTCAVIEVPLVVGGEEAKLDEFPHMALLGYNTIDNPSWFCGGSLISDRFVLTAAHCMSSREAGQVRFVRLGELQVSNIYDGSETQDINVAERITHPQYQPPARYNDIALLRLERAATFTAHVRPACLHRTKQLPRAGEGIKFIATGWGRVGYTEDASDKLLKVGLSPIPFDQCNRTYRNEATTSKLRRGIEDDSMVCAGELTGGKDTCQGDSGGPLQYVRSDPYCMYNIVGITSFGKFCGYSNSPAVYTRVAYYMDWIEGIVWT